MSMALSRHGNMSQLPFLGSLSRGRSYLGRGSHQASVLLGYWSGEEGFSRRMASRSGLSGTGRGRFSSVVPRKGSSYA